MEEEDEDDEDEDEDDCEEDEDEGEEDEDETRADPDNFKGGSCFPAMFMFLLENVYAIVYCSKYFIACFSFIPSISYAFALGTYVDIIAKTGKRQKIEEDGGEDGEKILPSWVGRQQMMMISHSSFCLCQCIQ
ncbi:hypothetical protein HELRODRAFT_174023 [Helobdella robusta]|uniref:Uncharacterized protein n=1 Tax=Helobdella robusta TaxID=6412 RepID=T1F7H8_HELRO|nr:hypothetical protein HELRODRAFT_174023 [Helobdella robusta]ESO03131.1 hypothetical protein HELRODRAFT_174023 [Helobdella robusta]